MAQLTQVQAALDTLKADIEAIPDAQPPAQPAAATEADLDNLLTQINAMDATAKAKATVQP